MSDDKNVMNHEYDGIKEFDNMLPRWWVQILYVSIAFSIGYWAYYHMGMGGKSQREIFDAEENARQEQQAAQLVTQPTGFSDQDLDPYKDPKQVAAGLSIYAGKCQACHAAGGAGLVGPNLADEFWIHGGKPSQIAMTISEGVPDKGMITWKTMLSREEILQVTGYILSLKGTNPPNGKAPQGDKFVQ